MTLVAGLDLGSTGIKLLVLDEQEQEVLLRTSSTPWQTDASGAVVMVGEALLTTVRKLLGETARDLASLGYDRVDAISVTGMGETGFLVEASGDPVAPAYAWFDRSGQDEVERLPDHLRAQFAGRTGLPWGVQVSAAKIAHLRQTGVSLSDTVWLGLPEFVVHALGGRMAAERSLVARTGLVDVETGQPWTELLTYLGVSAALLPPVVDAGSPLGSVDERRAPAAFAGAVLSVAGHDHLVSSLPAADTDALRYHVSLGTAEVLLRVIDTPLTFEARNRLATHLINCVPHVLPDCWVIVAGVKTGLLMRRALAMLGAQNEESRAQLDQAALDLSTQQTPPAVTVSGARNDDGVLSITVTNDDASPAALIRALLDHGNSELRHLIMAIDAELPPATSATLSGGWTSWASVVAARAQVLPHVHLSQRRQDTAYGAALGALRRSPATL